MLLCENHDQHDAHYQPYNEYIQESAAMNAQRHLILRASFATKHEYFKSPD
jgi:hypothetical protein